MAGRLPPDVSIEGGVERDNNAAPSSWAEQLYYRHPFAKDGVVLAYSLNRVSVPRARL